MKKREACGVMRALVITGGTVLALTSGATRAGAQAMPAVGSEQISGKILSVDLTHHILKVEAKREAGSLTATQPMDILFSESTEITEGGRTVQPSELRTGAEVRISYRLEGAKKVAHSVALQQSVEGGGTSKHDWGAQEKPEGGAQAKPEAGTPTHPGSM